jgi:hypothetical protein
MSSSFVWEVACDDTINEAQSQGKKTNLVELPVDVVATVLSIFIYVLLK